MATLALVRKSGSPVIGKSVPVDYAPMSLAQKGQIKAAAKRLSAEFNTAVIDYFERRVRYEAYAVARPEWGVWDHKLSAMLDSATLASVVTDLESKELVNSRRDLRNLANKLLRLAGETPA